MDVTVIGCGVIGLTTAIRLREAGMDASIVAAALPPDTTSSVAAAIWYPYKAYPEDRVLAWGKRTFQEFVDLSDLPQSGVRIREGVEVYRRPVPDPWWKEAVPGVRRCREDELPPGCRDGHVFIVPIIEMPVYLGYLMQRFADAGGTVEQRAVSSLEEAGDGVVVNCSGLGAREIAGDEGMSPIRGQVVRVRNPGIPRFILDEDNAEGVTYVVPRSEDCVLGGTADEGRWDTEPDIKTAGNILRRCARLEPLLEGAEVLEHKVGLRPGRMEVRLETEILSGGTTCVHNYGHGGSGVTLSWGCAGEAVGLVREAFGVAV
ncbi:MAG TPA: FAD-dependent oxidoreductase [Rubrobacteraceae bacterium]|nr:FAD-dependent oxidoreductase [Rubrobacteraceae bacterium]